MRRTLTALAVAAAILVPATRVHHPAPHPAHTTAAGSSWARVH